MSTLTHTMTRRTAHNPRDRVYLKTIAAELGYSERHIRRMMNEGDIPKRQRAENCTVWMYREELDAVKRSWGM